MKLYVDTNGKKVTVTKDPIAKRWKLWRPFCSRSAIGYRSSRKELHR